MAISVQPGAVDGGYPFEWMVVGSTTKTVLYRILLPSYLQH